MRATAIRTPILHPGDNLDDFLHAHVPQPEEGSILVIASKIIATAQQRIVAIPQDNPKHRKHELVAAEADWFLPAHSSQYDLMLTIKDTTVFVNAGIDELNIENHFLLWPQNPQQVAAEIWQKLRAHFQLKHFGVTISDSTSIMLNWGVIGRAIGYAGFYPLRDYRGTPDIFGRPLKMSQSSIAQAVTAAAVLEMGEGNEQLPLALVSELSGRIEWQDRPPTKEELDSLKIEREDDAYAPLLTSVKWHRGGSGNA